MLAFDHQLFLSFHRFQSKTNKPKKSPLSNDRIACSSQSIVLIALTVRRALFIWMRRMNAKHDHKVCPSHRFDLGLWMFRKKLGF